MAHPDFQKFLLSDPTIGEVYRVNNKRQGIKNLDKKIKKSPKDLRALVGSFHRSNRISVGKPEIDKSNPNT